ncbi:ketopantoate reductase family protein [Agromyces bracchium]|uniref:2-dehydropantoate 2-reductase n=1 Tax=Agromyces bracchium TaxID=88376 RepID=A0A6I3M9B6_9MICO|nr:2-dehydropantoate 2-reductase [Agromyces bracchium]
MAGAPRIAVLGAGANGAGIGADLTRAGHDVTFVEQWPEHVEAMRDRGIRVEMPGLTEVTRVRAHHFCEVAELREPFDLVFVAVKAYDTRWACELIRPVLAEDGLVVGVQNGMTVDDMADVVGPERTIGAVIEIAANLFRPGVVERQNRREETWFAVGGIHPLATRRVEEVADVLRAAGHVEVSADIRSSKWMKLVVNAAELVPSAILDLPLDEAVREPGMREFMVRTGREAVRTALDDGASLIPIIGMTETHLGDADRFADRLLEIVLDVYTLPSTLTTVLQDWRKGRRAEIEELNGFVSRAAERSGGVAPCNARVAELAREIEAGRRTAGRGNLAELIAAVPA